MALTYRTGSGGKGSALTIEELDNNFRHFTGSHSITGSLDISGSLNVSGSVTADYFIGDGSQLTNLPIYQIAIH